MPSANEVHLFLEAKQKSGTPEGWLVRVPVTLLSANIVIRDKNKSPTRIYGRFFGLILEPGAAEETDGSPAENNITTS